MLVELPLYVRESEAPELYKASVEDALEVGPFVVSAALLSLLVSCARAAVLLCRGRPGGRPLHV